jgi:hypothetical protein
MAVTQRATAVHRIRLIGELHTFFRQQKTRRGGFFVGRLRPQPREGIKVPAKANTELGAVIFKVLLGLANTPRLTAG